MSEAFKFDAQWTPVFFVARALGVFLNSQFALKLGGIGLRGVRKKRTF